MTLGDKLKNVFKKDNKQHEEGAAQKPEQGQGEAQGSDAAQDAGAELASRTSPVFDPKDVSVIYVLGGPGAGPSCSLTRLACMLNGINSGKGTQCARLVEERNFVHLSGSCAPL